MKANPFGTVAMLKLAATLYFALIFAACAQDQGLTASLNFVPQTGVQNDVYTLLMLRPSYNTFPNGSVISTPDDFAFVAPRAGIVRFSGQFWVITDPEKPAPINPKYVVKISKNAAIPACVGGDVIAGIGGYSGASWTVVIPVQGEDLAAAGDVYRWCISVTTDVGSTSFIDGNPAHTRMHVSMSNP